MTDLPLANRHDTILPDPPAALRESLREAVSRPATQRKRAVGDVVATDPTFIAGWAELAALGDEPIERYAYARVGYHRGLDALRGAGWGGVGLVRWSRESNRAFLTCLARLRAEAEAIGEHAEVERITAFLADLDPDWDDANLPG